jgi:hypothetical protein
VVVFSVQGGSRSAFWTNLIRINLLTSSASGILVVNAAFQEICIHTILAARYGSP